MKKSISIIALLLSGTILLAQSSEKSTAASKGFGEGLGAADYSFNVGSQVGTTFNDAYWFSNYFSPNVKLNLTQKFSLVAGVGVSYTQMNNFPVLTHDFKQESINATQTSFYTYASGIYKLTPKVNVNATVMFEEALINTPNGYSALSKQYKDVSMGINYNITRHFSVNAQMQLSNRPYNPYNNRNSNFGLNSPFNYSPFY